MECTNWIVLWHNLIGSIYIHTEQVTSKFIDTGEWVEKRWKNLTDTFQKKEKSSSAGESMADKAVKWQFYDHISFMKPYIGATGNNPHNTLKSLFTMLSIIMQTLCIVCIIHVIC